MVTVQLTEDEVKFIQHLIFYRHLIPPFDPSKEIFVGVKLLLSKIEREEKRNGKLQSIV